MDETQREALLKKIPTPLLNLGLLAYALTADREWAAALLDEDENGSARRAYVRVMLAFVEGMTSAFKGFTLDQSDKKGVVLSPGQLALLREEQYELQSGDAAVRQKLLPAADNVLFAICMLARVVGEAPPTVTGDQGWQAFRRAIKVRNRVTHPRLPHDLAVSDDDLVDVDKGIAWFEEQTGRLLQGVIPPKTTP